jgi:hypothetical protein
LRGFCAEASLVKLLIGYEAGQVVLAGVHGTPKEVEITAIDQQAIRQRDPNLAAGLQA